jgi:hypothetical protein
MFSEELDCCLLHGSSVQRTANPGGPSPIDCRTHPAIQYVVLIPSSARREAGVKIVRDRAHPKHGNPGRQVGVGTEHPGALGPVSLGVEMHDLTARMNAGVSPTGTVNLQRMIGDSGQRILQTGLDCRRLALALPAEKPAAVILDPGSQPHAFI